MKIWVVYEGYQDYDVWEHNAWAFSTKDEALRVFKYLEYKHGASVCHIEELVLDDKKFLAGTI